MSKRNRYLGELFAARQPQHQLFDKIEKDGKVTYEPRPLTPRATRREFFAKPAHHGASYVHDDVRADSVHAIQSRLKMKELYNGLRPRKSS